MKSVFSFEQFKGFNETFGLKMFEKFYDGIPSVHFGITIIVFNTAFFENVIESEGGFKFFVRFNFDDAADDVAFKHNVHESVADIRSIEERDIVAQKLVPLVCNFHERRFSVEVNDRGILSVDNFIVEMSGKNGRKLF